MKQRLLVLNGQRIVQVEQDGTWKNKKVDRAGLLKPGLYNLYSATQAAKDQAHDGTIVYVDDAWVYQQKGRAFTAHVRAEFKRIPQVGQASRISYGEGGHGAIVGEPPAPPAKSRSKRD